MLHHTTFGNIWNKILWADMLAFSVVQREKLLQVLETVLYSCILLITSGLTKQH